MIVATPWREDLASTSRSVATPTVVRFGALGDMILLLPFLHMLRRRWGRPCDVVGSGSWLRPLLEGHPDVGNVIDVASRRRPYVISPDQWRLVDTLRSNARGPIYVCDEHAVDKIRALLEHADIAPERAVYADELPMLAREHWIDRWQRFARHTPPAFAGGVPRLLDDALRGAPELVVDERDRADLRNWLLRRSLLHVPLVLLQAGNKRTLKRGRFGQIGDDKAWPSERWRALIEALLARDPQAHIILCGAPAEAPLLERIRARAKTGRVHVAAEDLPLRRLLALQQRARGMISIDSGPAHTAAAVGCPLVVLYGAASPDHWLPRSPSGSDVVALKNGNRVADVSLDAVLAAWGALHLRHGADAFER